MGAHHHSGRARTRSRTSGPGRHRAVVQRTGTAFAWSAPVTVAALSVSLLAASQANASTLISIGATGSWTDSPVAALQQWSSTHDFSGDPVSDTRVVRYPASLGFIGMPMGESVAEGAAALLRTIESIPGKRVITCESQGCMAVTQLLTQFAADPGVAPLARDLIVVMVGNPATAGGGASAQNPGVYEPFFRITFPGATPETQYETINVTREYDFFADRPIAGATALSLWNNLVAFLVVHPFYGAVDVRAPENLIKIVGNTTYVLVPTKRLPMLQSLYDTADAWRQLTGQTNLLEQVEALDTRLRIIIDQDYDRGGFAVQGSAEPDRPVTEPQPSDSDHPDQPIIGTAKAVDIPTDDASSDIENAHTTASSAAGESTTELSPIREMPEAATGPADRGPSGDIGQTSRDAASDEGSASAEPADGDRDQPDRTDNRADDSASHRQRPATEKL